jgi:ATP-dependent Clp protease adaptor protein ClpS
MPSKIREMAGTTLDTDINKSTKDELSKLYKVIILNDDDHTFEYVIEMLQTIFGFPYATALAHTMEADATGSSIVLTTNLEEAEAKRDQIHAYGPDWRLPHSRGSVAALVEPA